MIAAPSLRRGAYAGAWRLAGIGLLLVLSLVAVVLALLMQEYAAFGAIGALVVAATLWRPRYGIYASILLALAFEGLKSDPLMLPGFIAQSDVSTWSPLRFVNFTPIEFLVGLVGVIVAVGALADRRLPHHGQLLGPLVVFIALLFVSAAYGVGRGGGSLNIALWEIRSLALGGLLALLIPVVLRREHVDTLLNLLVLGAVLLSLDIIWRRFVLLAGVPSDNLVLAFGHETPLFLNTVVLLLVARLIWPASRRARLTAFAIPLILFAEALTERRAGWVTLDIGLVLVAIFVFRLKRRAFWLLLVPLMLLYSGYVVAFWNAQGTLAQPARAVHSLSNPDARDASSDTYRQTEIADIRIDIKAHPITGLGFGQPYPMPIPLPDLSANWPFWRYFPHDAFLWVWLKMGPLGFVALLTLVGAAIARGIQLLKLAAHSRSAPALVALVGALLMILVYSYVDIGLTSSRSCMLLGLALGVVAAWGREPAQMAPEQTS